MLSGWLRIFLVTTKMQQNVGGFYRQRCLPFSDSVKRNRHCHHELVAGASTDDDGRAMAEALSQFIACR
jgi:hypothetical protein